MSGREDRPGLAVLRGGLVLVGLMAVAPACTSPDDESAIVAFTSANLGPVVEAVGPAFEATTGLEVRFVLGATGALAAQIRNGAPADLFLAADEATLDALVDEGRIDGATRRVYALGRLALVVPAGRTLPSDLLGLDATVGLLAMANPDHAPYGRAAREALEATGLYTLLASRIVLAENVGQALQFVQTGNADAGLVALGALAGAGSGSLPFVPVDAGLHAPLRQAAGVVQGSPRAEEALLLLNFLRSPEGSTILARHGFETPDADPGSAPVERPGP